MSLYESFKDVYKKENALAPYSNRNLYSTIHLSENDHTQILWDIIRYRKNGKYVFFKSFIANCLGIDNFEMNEEKVVSVTNATQFPSLSNSNEKTTNKNKKYGFIDLLLKDSDKVIIIENKVCDASDGENQLTRYFYTFAKYDNDKDSLKTAKVKTDSSNEKTYEDENIYVVYLSKDESTVFPSKESNSLPDFLQKRLKLINSEGNSLYETKDFIIPDESHYIHISYTDDILPWLKDYVLPEISAYNSPEFFHSMCLYVDYLENDLLGQTQKSRDLYMSDSYNEIFDKYYQQNGWSEWIKLYDELIEKNKSKEEQTQEELQVLSAYIIFMRAQLSKKLNENLNSGWKAYCTPSFVLFYKEDWRKLSPNTDIPVLNLYLSPSGIKSLLNKNKTQYNISFNIERVKFDEQNWKKNLKNKLTNALSKEPTMTNKSQIYRFKDTYSIKLNNDKLFVECCNEEVKQIINNVSQQTK